jgi:heat shock protein HslJ
VRVKGYWIAVLSALLPLGVAACGSGAGMAPARVAGTSQSLMKTAWVLVSYGPADAPKSVLPGSQVTALFDEQPSRVGGVAGCNNYGGGYAVEGDRLTVSELAATKKFCNEPEGVMAQEQEYLTMLQAAERYRIEDKSLEIRAKDDRVLRFRERE